MSKTMVTVCLCAAGMVLGASATGWAAPLGTVFTYQGRLTDGGSPANGLYDFTFRVYDAESGVVPLDTDSVTNVSVADGYFTAEVDFGSGVFTGEARWLEIDVRPTGSVDFTTLSPRQEMTPTPYALYALDGPGSGGFWTDSGNDIYNTNSGNVGIGTSNPADKLHVENSAGNNSVKIRSAVNAESSLKLFEGNDYGFEFLYNGMSDKLQLWSRKFSGNEGARMTWLKTGNVGIRTTDPERDLHIADSGYAEIELEKTDTPTNKWHISVDGDSLNFLETGIAYVLTLLNGGNVGIGVTNPTARLHIESEGAGLLVTTSATDGHAAEFISSLGMGEDSVAVYAHNDSSIGGIALLAENDSIGSANATAVLRNTDTGSLLVGYGGTDRDHEFEICNDGAMEIYNSAHHKTIELLPGESGRIILANETGGESAYLLGGVNDGGALYLRNGSGSSTIELYGDYLGTGDGRIVTEELQITGGSDLSEQFDISSASNPLQPGMVVSIDAERPGKLVVSQEAYDTKVAGIISGARGIKPGMMMGQKGTPADGFYPVALTGRVYCRADASKVPIQPGDLLTTSDTPGYAMKVTDYSQAQGAILGKAMTSLETGKGLVLVLVSLQ